MRVRGLGWHVRRRPLAADGVAGVGEVGKALARRLLVRPDAGSFRGVAGETTLVLLGRDPPWTDGAVYLGREPGAPGLWVPTRLQLDLDASQVSRKLRGMGLIGPVALLPEQGMAIPLSDAGPVVIETLREWL